ncbi:MAG: hypothetical protein M1608_07045 [Candidatus Omnitrophica bacterium]|nr:hypothetical protein [Candidatus Omnitrophota bacterium]
MPEQFGAFTASELYCPNCRQSQPVRERLLLVLPSGELYEYLCSQCAASLGKRTVSGPNLSTPPRRPVRIPGKLS